MTYDLGNELQAEAFQCRCRMLLYNKRVVSLTEKRLQRTVRQNSYLHSALGYYALQTGYTLEEAKQWHFKEECNPQLFMTEKADKITGTVRRTLRSTSELTTEEMAQAIERFRNWAAVNAGVYIPSPEEHRMVMQMELEVARGSHWL